MSSYMCVGEHKSYLTACRPLVTKCNKSLVSSRAFLNLKRALIKWLNLEAHVSEATIYY